MAKSNLYVGLHDILSIGHGGLVNATNIRKKTKNWESVGNDAHIGASAICGS